MSLGNIALGGVIIVTLVYVGILVGGMIALFPYGLIGLAALLFVGFLLWGVLRQKLSDPENRHYEDNISK
ncbi:hypothetical protein [Parvularcula sp. LCG005]|uniref:hypothetical protein n=1 Tax=Parvularcula sp. LCG005 TaxID=3078805 RepID=UPI0029437DA3|nr:hypothetical protein [Parvularcula sp. LCG005]WOI52877.1 hypothetical protein RUI03_12040 [Parvularcula sp. LCG005]